MADGGRFDPEDDLTKIQWRYMPKCRSWSWGPSGVL